MECVKECNKKDGHAPECPRYPSAVLKHNRVPGDPGTSVLFPAAGGTVGLDLRKDFYEVPSTIVAGTPAVTANLPGAIAGSTHPADGDEFLITDAFRKLAAGTTVRVVGKIGSLGFQIIDGSGALVNSLDIATTGARARFRFSLAYGGVWVIA